MGASDIVNMTTPYLLDTSAFRAIGTNRLRQLAAVGSLFVSPFCFWEVVSHLDEPDQFRRMKGNLMKFRHVKVLDDPEAESLGAVGGHELLKSRVPDEDVVYGALAALQASDSLDSFYAKHIRDSQGNVRSLSACVERAKDILQREEERFVGFVRQIVDSVRAGTSTFATPWDRHRATVSLINGWHIARYKQPLNEKVTVLRVLYVYFAFVVLCARDRVSGSDRDYPNDYEDARLCQHLRLNVPWIVVSGDHRQRERLKEIFALLDEVRVPGLEHSHNIIPPDMVEAEQAAALDAHKDARQ